MSRVRMDVYCGGGDYGCGSLMKTYFDVIEEKYPFYCPTCEQTVEGKWPFTVKATIEEDSSAGE